MYIGLAGLGRERGRLPSDSGAPRDPRVHGSSVRADRRVHVARPRPGFIANWHITNGEAGWITGLFYAAYTVSLPVLVTRLVGRDVRRRVGARLPSLAAVGLVGQIAFIALRPRDLAGDRGVATSNAR